MERIWWSRRLSWRNLILPLYTSCCREIQSSSKPHIWTYPSMCRHNCKVTHLCHFLPKSRPVFKIIPRLLVFFFRRSSPNLPAKKPYTIGNWVTLSSSAARWRLFLFWTTKRAFHQSLAPRFRPADSTSKLCSGKFAVSCRRRRVEEGSRSDWWALGSCPRNWSTI